MEWDDSDDAHRIPKRSPKNITAAEKVEFLQHIRSGLNRQEAAKLLGYTGRHFRAVCSPSSPFYDEQFASKYGEAKGSLEHEEGRLERLQAEAHRRAMGGSDRLLEKLLMVYWPEWREAQSSQTQNVNVNVRQLLRVQLRSLPTDQLKQLLDALDDHEVIDATLTQQGLPLGGTT